MANIKFTNFARSKVATGIGAGDTTLAITGGTGALFPALTGAEYFYLTLENASLVREIVKVTARTTDTLTIVRAQDGTTAAAWVAGDVVSLRFNAAAISEAVTGTLLAANNLSDVANAATARANIGAVASGDYIGAATAATQTAGDNSAKVATTAFVSTALTNGIVGTSGNQTIAGVKTFSSMPVVPTQSMIRVNTANGFGSTNTCIKRYTTTVVSQGTDITYADSATLGATFTINTNGVYVISGQVQATVASYLGASLNSAQGTTSINTITAADKLIGCAGVGGNPGSFSVGVYLASGDVIRPHSDGTATSVAASENFTVTRVG